MCNFFPVNVSCSLVDDIFAIIIVFSFFLREGLGLQELQRLEDLSGGLATSTRVSKVISFRFFPLEYTLKLWIVCLEIS